MNLREFIRNIDVAVHNSFFLSLLWVLFWFGGICLVSLYVIFNPTVQTFSVIGALLFVRILYAGCTGR